MDYEQILRQVFVRDHLPPSETLSWGAILEDAFEPTDSHPHDWTVHDPVSTSDRALAASQLRRKINHGVLSLEDGEARAREIGCYPLNSSPTPENIDVRAKPRWTLVMVLAWMMWRDVGAVRAVDPDGIMAHRTWVRVKRDSRHTPSSRALFEEALGVKQIPFDEPLEGWILLPMSLSPLRLLQQLELYGLDGVRASLSLEEAMRILGTAALEDKLVAEGLSNSGWSKIPSVAWNGLRLESPTGLNSDRVVGDGLSYSGVVFAPAAVITAWPTLEGQAPNRLLKSNDLSPLEEKNMLACVGALLADEPRSKKFAVREHLRDRGWQFSDRCFYNDLWNRIVRAFPESGLDRAGRKKSPL